MARLDRICKRRRSYSPTRVINLAAVKAPGIRAVCEDNRGRIGRGESLREYKSGSRSRLGERNDPCNRDAGLAWY